MGSEQLHNEVILTSSSVCVAREYRKYLCVSPREVICEHYLLTNSPRRSLEDSRYKISGNFLTFARRILFKYVYVRIYVRTRCDGLRNGDDSSRYILSD